MGFYEIRSADNTLLKRDGGFASAGGRPFETVFELAGAGPFGLQGSGFRVHFITQHATSPTSLEVRRRSGSFDQLNLNPPSTSTLRTYVTSRKRGSKQSWVAPQ